MDEGIETASAALRIGRVMATEIPGNVGVIELFPLGAVEEPSFGRSTPEQTNSDQRPAVLRKSSRQILSNLWLVPCYAFVGEHHEGLAASWLRGRLSELRLEFDYVLINAPPVNRSSEAALLGSLTDGVIMTITANVTRRVAAQKSQSTLRQANARLLEQSFARGHSPYPSGFIENSEFVSRKPAVNLSGAR
jgi:hypothetical protein